MKLIICFIKTFKENLRDWKIFILVIVFAPFFVFLLHFYFSNTTSDFYNAEDFNFYIPSMLIFAVMMMLFTAGASIVREVEKDTITRLSLSNLKSPAFLTALSINQVIIGLISLTITLLASLSVGYSTTGSIMMTLIIGTLASFSVISISIITACFIRTMFGLLTLGCFPFFLMVFFSDCFIPLPKINLFKIGGNDFFLTDILPTATATRTLNEVLNHDAVFSDIVCELLFMTIMTVLYFLIGVWLFKRKFKY